MRNRVINDNSVVTKTKTACSYCGVGCGMVVETEEKNGIAVITKVRGDKEHPTNFGRLCTKGQTHTEMMQGEGRMTTAYLRQEPRSEARPVSVADAVREAGKRLRAILETDGPDAISLYVSGQMSLEAQYLANKLAKGYLRTQHIESNSRLCMASAGTGYKQSLGADGPPGSYQDFDSTQLFFVIGSNMADCHPILYLRMADRLKAGARLIVVDPRRTTTAEKADLFLQIRPGTDVALLNGLLHLLVAHEHIDRKFITEHTQGWEGMEEFLLDYTPDRVGEITGLSPADIRRAAEMIAVAGDWMSCWTMGLNQSTHGVWSTNALCNLHMATGALCKKGAGPFSLTGQPNAMGGREMGYMGPGLPGQRSVTNAADRQCVEEIWGLAPGTIRADVGPGTVELFRQLESGKIKACWIVCTNPVASVANRQQVINGLQAAELVISQDAFLDTATNPYADILLPAALWAESEGVMINSERTLTLLQKSIPAAGQALPDWKLICLVATELGFGEAFAFQSSEEVFDELRRFENRITGWDLRGASYDRLRRTPVQWPCPPEETDSANLHPIRYRNDGISQDLYVREDGSIPKLAFPTPSRRAIFLPRPHLEAHELPTDAFPLVFNTGRLQHQWHTMTKTGKVGKLNKLNPAPFLEIHPLNAKEFDIEEGQQVRVRSRRGEVILPAVITDRIREGSCFAPFHWTDVQGDNLTVNAVTNDAVDPDSLQPELKVCAVTLEPLLHSQPRRSQFSLHEIHPPPHGVLHNELGPLFTQPLPPLSDAENYYLSGFWSGLADGAPGVPVLPPDAPVRDSVRWWVNGVLAGMSSRSAEAAMMSEVTEKHSGTVVVAWASQTGNAEEYALHCATTLIAQGLSVREVNMDELTLADLAHASAVLLVSSTFGTGGPPDNGGDFWCRLSTDSELQLAEIPFAVFGIGDRSYEEFCGHATQLDNRMAELGACRLLPVVQSESDEEEMREEWITSVCSAIRDTAAQEARATVQPLGEDTTTKAHTRTPIITSNESSTNSTSLVVLFNTVLSGPASVKEIRHLSFDNSEKKLTYEVGDALVIYPENSVHNVEAWLEATGLDGSSQVTSGIVPKTLFEALITDYDICRVSTRFLRLVAQKNIVAQQAEIFQTSRRDEQKRWLRGRVAVDILREYPVSATPEEWVQVIPRLQPRHYSISSSPHNENSTIELTVGVACFDGIKGDIRKGVCSDYLSHRSPFSTVRAGIQQSPHFRIPTDADAPIIMIGPGTGVAPFRGFLQERRALGQTGKNWLFFGDQHEADNFYYRSELEDMSQKGLLTHLDLAFSRDQPARVYVQDRMREQECELWRWIDDGAYLYVCGDATRMAKDVDATLVQIISRQGKMSLEAAETYKKILITEKRYCRDVY